MRSEESHKRDLSELEACEPPSNHVRGVTFQSPLNGSLHFHTTKNKTIDIMHVFYVGVVPYETGCTLYILINVLKVITLTELNNCLRNLFNTLEVDESNAPVELTEIKLPGQTLQ